MKKYILALFVLLPFSIKAQQYPSTKPDRTFTSSVEIGGSTFNTNILEMAALVGVRDNQELATLEVGYVYKRILNHDIGHSPNYHGLRGAIEVTLINDVLGTYGTYDIIAGKRWLFDDVLGGGLTVHRKIHGEGTLGVFYAPKSSLFKFYAGIEPQHYNPSRIKRSGSPHKSSSINLKLKYTLDL
ncbi:MAG: hypothetical protein ACQUHE_08620 [Bacteroidia bacterium]